MQRLPREGKLKCKKEERRKKKEEKDVMKRKREQKGGEKNLKIEKKSTVFRNFVLINLLEISQNI